MKKSVLVIGLLVAALALSLAGDALAQKKIVVGSKEFTEQRILGQIMIALLEKNGYTVDDKTGLGGTLVMRQALVNGQIDLCMEYTGTGLVTILKEKPIFDAKQCYEAVKKLDLEKNGIVWMPPIPFNNTYCLMMRKADSEKLKIKTISELAAYVDKHPKDVAFGLNSEFYARPDGYKPLQVKYDFKFPEDKIVKMDPGLLYKALKDGQIQVAMGFATDGRIKEFDLVVLDDDKNYFPIYNPCPVVKKEIAAKYPDLEKIFAPLTQKLTTAAITNLNFAVDGEKKQPKDAAREWLKSVGLL